MKSIFRESKPMSSFQLVSGFAPSILGIPHRVVSIEELDAHIQREATCAIERIMRSNVAHVIETSRLAPGTRVFVYYKSSNIFEAHEWIRATVVSVGEHI